MSIDAKRLAKMVQIKVRFKQGRQWAWRMWLARWLIALAGHIAWFEIDITTKE